MVGSEDAKPFIEAAENIRWRYHIRIILSSGDINENLPRRACNVVEKLGEMIELTREVPGCVCLFGAKSVLI